MTLSFLKFSFFRKWFANVACTIFNGVQINMFQKFSRKFFTTVAYINFIDIKISCDNFI